MTPKERALTAFAHCEPDRVPIDYLANSEIDRRLKAYFGLDENDDESLRVALNVDFRAIRVPYLGPPLHKDISDRRIDLWGVRTRWVEHASGGYWDYCDFPLKDATLGEVEAWPMPSPDDFDYDAVASRCKVYRDYCIVVGDPGFGDIINSTGMIRTMEQVLIDLMTDEPAALCFIDRRLETQLEILRRALEAGAGGIDLLWMGEDLGTQIAPMISPGLYDRHFHPRHKRFVDLAKSFDIPVMFHSCGSSSWAFRRFIEMGVKVIDTLQPEAKDMAPAHLKSTFGAELSFHGCISTAGSVANGTVEETVADVEETLSIMMPGGGYAFAPTHMLQDNSPTENVVAMYDAALKIGRYR